MRKHKELIKAYLDNPDMLIEFFDKSTNTWILTKNPKFKDDVKYREYSIYNIFTDAYNNGKTVELNIQGNWMSIEIDEDYIFIYPPEKYRIVSEPKIEYIPYDVTDNEMLLGCRIRDEKDNYFLIVGVDKYGVIVHNDRIEFDELLRYYRFISGDICGKLIKCVIWR